MVTICDVCKKEIKIEIVTKQHEGSIIEQLFICQHCKAEYTITKTNSKIRGLQKNQRRLEEKVKKANRSMNEKEYSEWQFRQRRIKELIEELNG